LITQRFGKTVDARRLYVSGSHSGVDFRAAVGTPVYAAAAGTVEGVGDTDTTCPKASFGKWVFIRHTNGLATAYGHLSLIKATEGQKVAKGDLIGYSGNTGHSTAPHLHLTVYASNGVDGQEGARVTERASASCKGKVYRMPIAPTNAYLDPLLYLPKASASLFKDGKGGSTSE
jgi:murein DD-endopeptidase MepM/ murein hydrolase activator NlpD